MNKITRINSKALDVALFLMTIVLIALTVMLVFNK